MAMVRWRFVRTNSHLTHDMLAMIALLRVGTFPNQLVSNHSSNVYVCEYSQLHFGILSITTVYTYKSVTVTGRVLRATVWAAIWKLDYSSRSWS